jgi:hypothetical protein
MLYSAALWLVYLNGSQYFTNRMLSTPRSAGVPDGESALLRFQPIKIAVAFASPKSVKAAKASIFWSQPIIHEAHRNSEMTRYTAAGATICSPPSKKVEAVR